VDASQMDTFGNCLSMIFCSNNAFTTQPSQCHLTKSIKAENLQLCRINAVI